MHKYLKDLDIRVYDQNDGLNYKRALSVVQDEKDFIWVSTHDGICKYNGSKFTQFYHEPNNPNSLQSNDVNQMVFGKEHLVHPVLHAVHNGHDPVCIVGL